MTGWQVPPPTEPHKSSDDLRQEREHKVHDLVRRGLLVSELIRAAMLKVRREDFLPRLFRDYAYNEVPVPLPGKQASISCPHSYPLFYEPLGVDRGQRFLEVGLGSGYGAALAREIVGNDGLVVSVEIDPETFAFARDNLTRAGYGDIVLVQSDGGLGWPEHAPYDRICVTAACVEVPPPLIEQLTERGRLIAPILDGSTQWLTLLYKSAQGVRTKRICPVLYVSLQGNYEQAPPPPSLRRPRQRKTPTPPARSAGSQTHDRP
jgi:protein-L-isoaspartate(D-aspartate) O-methyltransferase